MALEEGGAGSKKSKNSPKYLEGLWIESVHFYSTSKFIEQGTRG